MKIVCIMLFIFFMPLLCWAEDAAPEAAPARKFFPLQNARTSSGMIPRRMPSPNTLEAARALQIPPVRPVTRKASPSVNSTPILTPVNPPSIAPAAGGEALRARNTLDVFSPDSPPNNASLTPSASPQPH